jgi:hypothetical protein
MDFLRAILQSIFRQKQTRRASWPMVAALLRNEKLTSVTVVWNKFCFVNVDSKKPLIVIVIAID